MNLERTKPETLAAAALDLTPSQSLAAHDYADRLNAALARLGLTDRLTLPPAPNTAIDELPAVVDVPLRKTLSVLMGKAEQGDASALATLEWTAQVAESIFAGLHARDFAGDRPLALPSHESLATLPQGVDALLPRKISTGWSVASLLADPTCDGIDDGVSLVRLLCSNAIDSVTELKDDNEGWVANGSSIQSLISIFSALKRLEINCKEIIGTMNQATVKGEVYAPELITLNLKNGYGGAGYMAKQMIMPKCREIYGHNRFWQTAENNIIVEKMVLGSLSNFGIGKWSWNTNSQFGTAPNLIHMEYGADGLGGLQVSQDLSWWTATNILSDSERLPIFLSNFKTYIAERLTDKGSGLTLTLSQAVRDAIEGDPTIAQIITSKGWTISPAPTA